MRAKLLGHEGEVARCLVSARGDEVLSVAADGEGRVWAMESGECRSTLRGHKDEVFGCAWNYEGDTIITASKDNTCRVWKRHSNSQQCEPASEHE